MYTEDTVLNYGSYRGKMIKDLPTEYIINVYKTGGKEHSKLKEYIGDNISKYAALILYTHNKEPVPFKCEKRTYPTKKAAMDSIVKSKSKTDKKVPIRAYECDTCSGWHLTSKPDRRFNNEAQD